MYLTPEQREHVLHKYKVVALYRCDHCNKPIPIGEMPVVDTTKGYHKRRDIPKNCRPFIGRHPRVTYHSGKCDRTYFGRKRYKKQQKEKAKYLEQLKQGAFMPKTKKDKKDKKNKSKKVEKSKKKAKKEVKADPKVKKAIIALITKKENHYTKRRVLQKLSDKFDKADIRDALAVLWSDKTTRKKDGKYYLVEEKEAA